MNITAAASLFQAAKAGFNTLEFLLGDSNTSKAKNEGTDFASLLANKSAATNSAGRNMALNDPESAYQMMSFINKSDVTFKAQYAELKDMSKRVEGMEDIGAHLSDIAPETSASDIAQQMRGFVDAYNTWVDRFAPTVQTGGVLDNVQAAEVSVYELEQSVRNPFNGVSGGVRGLEGLGISIDPTTHRATLDESKLNSVLAANKNGAVAAIDEFSANFAKSADLLNAPGNFLPKQLDNRSRAIDFIAHNISSLQMEFGTGDAAKPEGAIAKALAAYDQARAMA